MRRPLFLIPGILFLLVAAFFIAALISGKDPRELPSALIGKPAPAFDLAGFGGGERLRADGLKGNVVLINFFASWCVPCRAEQPLLMRLVRDEKLPLYGIDYKDDPQDAARFLKQLGDPFSRIGLDRDGRTGIDFGVYGVPETYVIDKQGRIRLRYVGPLTEQAVETELMPLVRRLQGS